LCCDKIFACTHPCNGVKNEGECLPCLHDDCGHDGQKGSDYCNIFWVEDLISSPSLKLICGHVFHYQCISTRIDKKWPGARITFGFLSCPLCKKQIAHPMLKNELDPVLKLFEDVKTKAVQRLSYEGLQNAKELSEQGGKYFKNPEAFALDKLAYYPCSKCKQPYFGGQRRCEEAAGEGQEKFDPSELVCGSCSSGSAQTCQKHGKDFIEFKCRFCCSVASWFCWGTTHFCDGCHKKQCGGDYLNRKQKNQLPQCIGAQKCPLKVAHPPTGEEFALGCGLCKNETF